MATILEQPAGQHDAGADSFNRLLARAYTLNWEAVAYIIIFLIAIFTRFYNLGDRVMSHDESLHTRYSYNLYAEGDFQHTPLMHGPILFHMTAFFYFLFGDNDFTARIYTALLGVLMVMFPLLFRRWLGRTGALVASVLLLISPIVMYYNRYIREDTPSVFFTLVMVYCIFMYLNGPQQQRRKARWLYIFSGAMLCSLGSKESGFMYVGIFGLFLTLYWFARMAQYFWKLPGKTLLYFVSIGILLGCVISLGMYVVLAIVPPATLSVAGVGSLEFSSFASWTALSVGLPLGALVGALLWAFRGGFVRIRLTDLLVLVLIAVVACALLIVAEEASRLEASAIETSTPAEPGQEGAVVQANYRMLPIVVAWVIGAAAVGVIIVSRFLGWWRTLHRFPELDILIVMGSLILPWLTAVIIALTGASPTDYSSAGIQRAALSLIPMVAVSVAAGLAWNWKRWLVCTTIFYVLFVFFFTSMFTNVQGLATGVIGSLGYWLEQQSVRRGNQPQYYYLLIIMPFYEFLPVIGSVFAMIAGFLRFWTFRRRQLEEQAVKDIALVGVGEKAKRAGDETPSLSQLMDREDDDALEQQIEAARARGDSGRLKSVPFLLFVSWWALGNLLAYTLAGEKMPWLAIHLTVPLIVLSGWYVGRLLDKVDWQKFARRGWLYLLVFPLLFVLLFQIAEPFLVGQSLFGGLQQQQLSELYEWLALIALAGLVVFFIYQLVERTGWQHLRHMLVASIFLGLGLLTFRSAWMASFVNYDLAREFLVYAHSAPAVKLVLNELEDISRRTTGGMDLKFAYDNETSWPNSWYYRHFTNAVFVGANPTPQNLSGAVAVVVGEANRSKVEPLLEDRYYRREYIRMWWPMQDYFGLTAQRIANTFDFSPANTQAAQIRRGMFDIWWSRNYDAYSQALGGTWNDTQWPVSDRMHFYVRRDIAAQIWNLGVGEGRVEAPEVAEVNLCTENWQPLMAQTVFMDADGRTTIMNHPIGLAVAADGTTYVAEEFNNRVSIFNSDGVFVGVLGEQSGTDFANVLGFNRPNSVAYAPDGSLYVADTWNFRINRVSLDGVSLRQWGQQGQFGFEAPIDPVDAFWGPRDVKVDGQGNVYVADTGNKRIRVYDASGVYLRDIGSGGSGAGQLDEPSGLAIHPDGRVFVADTWNRRVSVFTQDGTPLYQFNVRGWYDDFGNRPYLALDSRRNLLYVTDPDASRVLVYDTNGRCVGSFGQSGEGALDASQFKFASGITTDEQGFVYVSDAGTGRVLRFEPFPASAAQPEQAVEQSDGASQEMQIIDLEATDEAQPVEQNVTTESTPEAQ